MRMTLNTGALRRWSLAGGLWVVLAGLLAPSVASGQDLLTTRVLQVGDTRDLTAQAEATLTEGMASEQTHIRTLAVRAAGRFESSLMVGRILRLLDDPDAGVRQAATIAAASSARLSPDQVVDRLLRALGSASSADWAVLAASVGRVPLTSPDQYRRVEQSLVAALPVADETF